MFTSEIADRGNSMPFDRTKNETRGKDTLGVSDVADSHRRMILATGSGSR